SRRIRLRGSTRWWHRSIADDEFLPCRFLARPLPAPGGAQQYRPWSSQIPAAARGFLACPGHPSYPEGRHIAGFILVDQSKKALGLGAKAAYRDAVGKISYRRSP